jgi:hypothetical protein
MGCGRRNHRKEKKRKTNKMRTDSLIVGIKKKDDKVNMK